jgi:hypothetical protein
VKKAPVKVEKWAPTLDDSAVDLMAASTESAKVGETAERLAPSKAEWWVCGRVADSAAMKGAYSVVEMVVWKGDE